MSTFRQDIGYALRMLRKAPGLAAIAILTLALGIGANTAIFSMVESLIMRLPPISRPERVITLASQNADGDYDNGFSFPNYTEIRDQSRNVFSGAAGVVLFTMDGLSVDGNSAPIWVNYVTGNFFELLGVKPALGNFFAPEFGKSVDDDPVLVLSYLFWKSHFNGDAHIVGKSVLINGHAVTIIGIAPKGFHGISSFIDVQGYLPAGMAAVSADAAKDFASNRDSSTGMAIVARLSPGATLSSTAPVLKVIAQRLAAEYPATDKWRALVAYALDPMSPETGPDTPKTMRLLGALFLILAGLVLILACLNVTNLLLARAVVREREMAVRAAVGGSRSRLMRQLLTESLVLAALGSAGGIVLGLVASQWFSSINLRTPIPLMLDLQFDWRVFAYALGIALFSAVLVGVIPAIRATRGNLNGLLHENTRTATAARQRARSLLVVAQVGGSLTLLIVAGLFVRSLESVERADLGFSPNNVLNFTIDPHEAGYNADQGREFLQALDSRASALPGVENASLAMTVPMGYYSYGMELKIDGYQSPAGQRAPSAGYNAVSPRYFETMHIPLLRGRDFRDSDAATSPYVAVINEAMAEKYWRGENPIGRHFVNTIDPKHSIEIVGIVQNSRTDGNFSDPVAPYLYVALSQHYDYQKPVTLQLRANVPPATVNREVFDMIHRAAPAMSIFDVQTMSEALDTLNGFMLFQIGAGLAASLGILGLVLALVGVYGVVSYSASQRTHEIGIRVALGAQPADVLRMILRQGLLIVGAGLLSGILAAAAIARLVGNFLSGVSPVDPLTYAMASILLATIALLACYIPARRTMRVDPTVALRYE